MGACSRAQLLTRPESLPLESLQDATSAPKQQWQAGDRVQEEAWCQALELSSQRRLLDGAASSRRRREATPSW